MNNKIRIAIGAIACVIPMTLGSITLASHHFESSLAQAYPAYDLTDRVWISD